MVVGTHDGIYYIVTLSLVYSGSKISSKLNEGTGTQGIPGTWKAKYAENPGWVSAYLSPNGGTKPSHVSFDECVINSSCFCVYSAKNKKELFLSFMCLVWYSFSLVYFSFFFLFQKIWSESTGPQLQGPITRTTHL